MRRKWFNEEIEKLFEKKGSLVSNPNLLITEYGVVKEYTWKDIKSKKKTIVPAMYFVVKEKTTADKFVVVVARNPYTSKLTIWCSDVELHQKLGIKRHKCSFWKNKSCEHTSLVIKMLREPRLSDVDEVVNKFLSLLDTTSDNGIDRDRQVELETILSLWKPTLIVGPTGSGKSHTILNTLQQKKEAGELEYAVINFTSGLEDTDLLAKFIPTPDGKWEVRDGELTRAFKLASQLPEGKKYVIVLEELTRATPKALNVLVKAMDGVASEYVLQNFVTGEEIRVNKNKLNFIALANLGSSYSGTEELDPALMRRFLITRFWDYDTEKEKELLLELLDDDVQTVEKLQKFVKSQRDSYRRGQFPYPLDTGTLLEWVRVKKQLNTSFWEAFELTSLYRLVERDEHGFPDEVQVESLRELMQDLGL